MNRSLDIEIKVGIFVILGIVLAAFALIAVSSDSSVFEGKYRYRIIFTQTDGINTGSTVKLSGYRVGQVDTLAFKENGNIEVWISVRKKFAHFIKQDSIAQTGTQGMLGDKFINVTVGSSSSPMLDSGSDLKPEPSKDFKDYLSKGEQVLTNLNNSLTNLDAILSAFQRDGRAETFFRSMSTTASNFSIATKEFPAASKEMAESMKRLKNILIKMDRGDGTIGAFLNDQSLYDDLKALLGGANRNKVLKYFIKRSVEASRETAAQSQPQNQKK